VDAIDRRGFIIFPKQGFGSCCYMQGFPRCEQAVNILQKNQTVEDLQVTTNKVEGNLVESNFENSTKRKKQTVKDSRPLTQLSSLNLNFL
jgi:hypothetical protein